ncbi:MAG: ribonuclease H-like domain-containing protein [Candidatus Sumerlaeia bacterium]|nr:ribonuclease H-like domain-containing protein [Candidatus Sumerlaeia bacterium]
MKSDPRTTKILRRMRGRVFRASKLLDRPDTPWRRRRLLDLLDAGSDRTVATEAGGVLHLTLRVPYGAAEAACGLQFPRCGRRDKQADPAVNPFAGWGATVCQPRVMAKAARRPSLGRIRPHRIVVLDTETTGLLDEPETVPFLVGLGFFEPEHFVVEQFFMEDFEAEPALMKSLARRMRTVGAILTYNGGSFDLPLLRRRFTLQRLSAAAWEKTHWDVLLTARRLWKGDIGSCSLTNVEREVLGFRRERDIPSDRIPQVYRDYLGGHRAGRLAAVFDHNAQDILSTAAIAVTLGAVACDPCAALADGLASKAALERFAERE